MLAERDAVTLHRRPRLHRDRGRLPAVAHRVGAGGRRHRGAADCAGARPAGAPARRWTTPASLRSRDSPSMPTRAAKPMSGTPSNASAATSPVQPSRTNASRSRLKRVFRIDIERCPKYGGRVRIIACIETLEVIKTVLSHLAAREDGGARRARAPPPSPGGLAPSHSLTVSRPRSPSAGQAHPRLVHRAPGSPGLASLPPRICTSRLFNTPHGGSEMPAPDPSPTHGTGSNPTPRYFACHSDRWVIFPVLAGDLDILGATDDFVFQRQRAEHDIDWDSAWLVQDKQDAACLGEIESIVDAGGKPEFPSDTHSLFRHGSLASRHVAAIRKLRYRNIFRVMSNFSICPNPPWIGPPDDSHGWTVPLAKPWSAQ